MSYVEPILRRQMIRPPSPVSKQPKRPFVGGRRAAAQLRSISGTPKNGSESVRNVFLNMRTKVKMGQHRLNAWPARLPLILDPPAVSLWDCLAVSARRYPDRSALIFFDRQISYAELLSAAEGLAARLALLGVASGDRVLVVMQNCPQLIIAHYAIARANAVVVPVNPMNRAEELRHYIMDAKVNVAITTGDLAGEVASASNGISDDRCHPCLKATCINGRTPFNRQTSCRH